VWQVVVLITEKLRSFSLRVEHVKFLCVSWRWSSGWTVQQSQQVWS